MRDGKKSSNRRELFFHPCVSSVLPRQVATLEALIADLSIFPKTGDDRVSLYRLFSQLFDSLSVPIAQQETPFGWEKRAATNLEAVTPQARKAFLLIAVEGFRPAQAAEILDVDETSFSKLLETASMEISKQVATDIMIIEDEPLIAMDIEDMVESLGHRVTGVARTHDEAIELYKRTKPKMVLADIQLADGSSGIDAVNDILKDETLPVIFITAFPERLLTGEKPSYFSSSPSSPGFSDLAESPVPPPASPRSFSSCSWPSW